VPSSRRVPVVALLTFIALVKPTFELHAATLADQPHQVAAAAVEVFLHARRE